MKTESSTASDFRSRLAKMRIPPSDMEQEFYAVTLTADDKGQFLVGFQTRWVGYADDDRRVELREPSLVYARMAKAWEELGQSCVFVREEGELLIMMLIGGNALVAPEVAEKSVFFSSMLKPDQAIRQGREGFVNSGIVHSQAHRRVPTPKLRMEILNRDGRKCRICGRSPDANVDIELHVHHIRPWAVGGITDPANLITLCHTCHNGLEPHFDRSLFDYLSAGLAAEEDRFYRQGVENYRRFAATAWSNKEIRG